MLSPFINQNLRLWTIRAVLLGLFLAILNLGLSAQDGDILLFVDSNTVIGKLSKGKLYSSPNNISHTLVGNRLYEGDYSPGKEPILLIGVTNMFGRKNEKVFFEDAQDVAYTVRKGVLYLGDRSSYGDLEQLIRVIPEESGYFTLRSGIDDSNLGTIATNRKARPGELITILHRYVLHYNLDRQVNERIEQQILENESVPTGSGGLIRAAWDENPYFQWEWDGRNLKPAYGVRAEDEWTFDGKYIRPRYGTISRAEWIWDGDVLKQYWSTDLRNQWIWDRAGVLRRYWDGSPDEEWKFDGDRMRPHFNPDPRQTWIVEGDIPLPIIAFVVLGYADR